MNETSLLIRRQLLPDGRHEPSDTPATRPPGKPETRAKEKRRCLVSSGRYDGSAFVGEVARLLRSRLRVAALILLGPLAYFLGSGLLGDQAGMLRDGVGVALHALVTLLVVGQVVWLWSKWPLCLVGLRRLELVLFGAVAIL